MSVIALLIWLIVIAILIALVYYIVDMLGVPDPLNKLIKVVAVVVCCIVIIMLLLQVAGLNFPRLNAQGDTHAQTQKV